MGNFRKRIIFFIFLFITAVLMSVAYTFYINYKWRKVTSFLILKSSYPKQSLLTFPRGEILKRDKVTGKFKAKDNNMGIVEIRFLTYGRVNTDSFVFRLKEIGENKWYYTNTYKSKEFGGYPLFPFGFPIIDKSKDKEYYFELESLDGKSGNAVGISRQEPIIVVKHKYDRQQLLDQKRELLFFILKKSKEIIQESNLLANTALIYVALISPIVISRIIRESETKIRSLVRKKQVRLSERKHLISSWLIEKFIEPAAQVALWMFWRIFSFIRMILYVFYRWLGEK